MVLFEALDEIKFKIHHGSIGGIIFEGYFIPSWTDLAYRRAAMIRKLEH
jgi:hypothetical protein